MQLGSCNALRSLEHLPPGCNVYPKGIKLACVFHEPVSSAMRIFKVHGRLDAQSMAAIHGLQDGDMQRIPHFAWHIHC